MNDGALTALMQAANLGHEPVVNVIVKFMQAKGEEQDVFTEGDPDVVEMEDDEMEEAP